MKDKKYPKGLDASMQAAFVREITAIRERCLKGRRHWHKSKNRYLSVMRLQSGKPAIQKLTWTLAMVLRNLATRSLHERRGAATMLLQWPLQQAN